MIIPSIGLQGGHAVQLIGGDAKVPDAGDLRPLAWRFALISGITVVDLDAGLGQGANATLGTGC